MKKILVPVDFSEQSINAFRFSLDFAKRSGASITLLHVLALPVIHDSALMPVSAFRKPLLDDLAALVEKKFTRLIEAFNDNSVRVNTSTISGPIHASILNYLEAEECDIIIMGTKGASGIKEWTIGSNAERMVRTSPVPVISIKNYQPDHAIRNIVFPNTLETENQEALVTKVKALQNLFGATLHIVWVNTPALFKREQDVRQRLHAFADRFMLKDYTVNTFNFTDEEAGILEFANQVKGDLIAMGTHGLRGLAHFFSGSVAEDVVNHVKFPVWTYSANSAKSLSQAGRG